MPLLEGIHTLDAWMEKESRLRERWRAVGEPGAG